MDYRNMYCIATNFSRKVTNSEANLDMRAYIQFINLASF